MRETSRVAHARRGTRRVVRLLLTLLVSLAVGGGSAVAATGGQDSKAGKDPRPASARTVKTMAAMQPGWNLGNSLDAIPDEEAWGMPKATRKLLRSIKAQGFNSVRIPVTWSNFQSDTAPYTIDAAYLKRVKEVTDWAIAENLYVEMPVHHDSWVWISAMPQDHDGVRARFDSTWKQISATFRTTSSRLLFESVNEPQFKDATAAQETALLDELNTSFHKIVRGSGGNNASRVLVLPTLHATPSQALMDDLSTTMARLNDPNLAATVHYYGYYPFSANIAGGIRFDEVSKKNMAEVFGLMRDNFTAKGIPVYLGEFGLLGFDAGDGAIERGEMLKYFEAIGHAARTHGVTTALWDNGAFYDRRAMKWRDQGVFDQIKSSWTTRSATADSDLVFLPDAGPIPDRSVGLQLNGAARLTGLRTASGPVARADYSVSGDRLTLKSSLLTRLAGDRAHGVNARLYADFSAGVPWQFRIITAGTPSASDATGTTESFTVPLAFRGDLLATMEATYADGTAAGPPDWTTYKEYNRSFDPNEANDTVALLPAFFTAVRDGEPVTLTFHLWTGTKVTYIVTKHGATVTGKAA